MQTSVLDINLTLTLDVGFTLDFGHPTSQPKFNQISTSYDVVCLFCACWVHTDDGGAEALLFAIKWLIITAVCVCVLSQNAVKSPTRR